MARRKQVAPTHRADSSEIMQSLRDIPEKHQNGNTIPRNITPAQQSQASLTWLFICVGGIYGSFLSWAWLQERITTTAYARNPYALLPKSDTNTEYFRFPVFINLIQAIFAFVSGSIYLLAATRSYEPLPSRAAIPPLALISLTQTLASPFGYLSLAHVDYLTYTLAKSCKLLPVMALHITLFRKRYPLSKYIIVLAVTAGVAVFSLYNPPKPGKSKGSQPSSIYGLSLLGINLLFDGLTNSIQDHIFASPARYGKLKGPQMMIMTNAFSAVYMACYLFLTPSIPSAHLPNIAHGATTELSSALAFLHRHPEVWREILGFAACGACGQLFIFETLQRFSSLLLVTVTVTRKMLTMVLSVVLYGKQLTLHQWGGVGLVFGGIGSEAYLASAEKKRKMKSI
jgi:UDP-galactose transporter B1